MKTSHKRFLVSLPLATVVAWGGGGLIAVAWLSEIAIQPRLALTVFGFVALVLAFPAGFVVATILVDEETPQNEREHLSRETDSRGTSDTLVLLAANLGTLTLLTTIYTVARVLA